MEEVREVISEQEVKEAVAQALTPAPKPTKPKAKAERTLAELDVVAPRYMTDSEKNKYIMHIREITANALVNYDSMADSAKSAFDRARTAEDEMAKVRNNANLKLKQVEDNVRVMANNIMNILGGK